MEQRKIDSILVKFIENRISEKEADFLLKWMEDPDNKLYFDEFVEINYLINSKNSFDHRDSLRKTKEIINEKEITDIKWWKKHSKLLKYASIIVLFAGMTYYFVQQSTSNIKSSEMHLKNEEITLEMGNGTKVIIPDSAQQKIQNSNGKLLILQQGNKLNYQNGSKDGTLAYNKLTIPYGKTFQVQLSDGTLIHLNAGTTFRYPEKFIKGNNRMVFVDGEAYFEVAKDKKHPFIVNANGINIRVTGTKFNVSNYKEDEKKNVVLVEGAVSVYNKEETYNKNSSFSLTPGHKAEWGMGKKSISIEDADTSIYTAWMDGKLIFRDLPFNNIMLKLERHYNVKIINNNKLLGNKRFDATFDVETIEQVLNTINKNFDIKYTIENNQIIIN
jgi:transmembrane sensor